MRRRVATYAACKIQRRGVGGGVDDALIRALLAQRVSDTTGGVRIVLLVG